MWKELVVILKGMKSCWTITIDLLFSEEKYLIQRLVILVSKIFHKLIFSILGTFSFAISVVNIYICVLYISVCFLSCRS